MTHIVALRSVHRTGLIVMEAKLEKHRAFLIDRIDPDFGLLDNLLASGVLTRAELQKIKLNINTTCDKNRILLDFVLKNKKANELVSALRDCGHIHLINYLNADGDVEYGPAFGEVWPLSGSDISHLEINRESLIDILDTTELCIRLYSEEVINNRQKQFIFSKPTDAEKNEALLDIMSKFSLRQYNKTITCLRDSNQSHIANLLSGGGVLFRVHASLEAGDGNVDELEDEIITQLKRVLERRPLDEAIRLLELTKMGIIAAKKGHSIVLYIRCKTHNKMLQLINFLETNRLKEIVERVFIELLSIGHTLRVRLTWSSEEFTQAYTYFEVHDNFTGPSNKYHQRSVSTASDSDYRFLSGDLQSSLTGPERLSFSADVVEGSGHTDVLGFPGVCSAATSYLVGREQSFESPKTPLSGEKGWIRGGSKKLKPLRKIYGRDARTQTDEPIVQKKSDWIPAEVEEATSQSIILNSVGTQTECRNEENKSLLFDSMLADSSLATCGSSILSLDGTRTSKAPGVDDFMSADSGLAIYGSSFLSLDGTRTSNAAGVDARTEVHFYLRRKLEQTLRENDRLKKLLEHETSADELPEKYKSNPRLVHTIKIKTAEQGRKWINGLEILDQELFVVNERSSEVEVYDSIKFTLSRRWTLKELIRPLDIGSCNRNKCIYIFDYKDLGQSKEIFRIDPRGEIIKKWSTGDDWGIGLSVTDESNVILAVYKNKLNEYSPDGQLIREIDLSLVADISTTTHAMKLNSDNFMVSLCIGENLHTLCIVDADGKLKKSLCERCRSIIGEMTSPVSFSVDENKFVLVADKINSRVLLLDSELNYRREILSKEETPALQFPWRTLLDESNGRLFVSDNQRIFIFQFR